MDAETRHHLKTNELAEALSKVRSVSDEKLLPWLIGIVVILLAFLGVRWWNGAQEAKQVNEWSELNRVNVAGAGPQALEPLEQLANEGLTPGVRHAAMLKIGQESLRLALTREIDRAQLLKSAENALDRLLKEKNVAPTIAASAKFVLATVYESQARPDEAETLYNELKTDAPGTPFAIMAESRLGTMEQARVTVEFLPGSPLPDLPIIESAPDGSGPRIEATPIVPAPTPEPAAETPDPAAETPPAEEPAPSGEPNNAAAPVPVKEPNRTEP